MATEKESKDKSSAPPPRNYVAVARGRDLVVIRLIGRGTMLNAPALQDFADEQRKAGYLHFLFDFERCTGLDSTFMGVMVGMYSPPPSDSSLGLGLTVPAFVDSDMPKSPDDTNELEPMSPEEALASLAQEGIGAPKKEARSGTVSAASRHACRDCRRRVTRTRMACA